MKNTLLEQEIYRRKLDSKLIKEKKEIELKIQQIKGSQISLNKNDLNERIKTLNVYLKKEFRKTNRLELSKVVESFQELLKFYRQQLQQIRKRYGDEAEIPTEDLDNEDNIQSNNKFKKFFDKTRVRIEINITNSEIETMDENTIILKFEEIKEKLKYLKKKIEIFVNYLQIEKIITEKIDSLFVLIESVENKIISSCKFTSDVVEKFKIYMENVLGNEEGNEKNEYDMRKMDAKIIEINKILNV